MLVGVISPPPIIDDVVQTKCSGIAIEYIFRTLYGVVCCCACTVISAVCSKHVYVYEYTPNTHQGSCIPYTMIFSVVIIGCASCMYVDKPRYDRCRRWMGEKGVLVHINYSTTSIILYYRQYYCNNITMRTSTTACNTTINPRLISISESTNKRVPYSSRHLLLCSRPE